MGSSANFAGNTSFGPVAAGGRASFGNTFQGGSSTTFTATRVWCGAMDAPDNSGTLDTIFLYSEGLSSLDDVSVGLYADSTTTPGIPDTLIGLVETLNIGAYGAEWHEFDADGLNVTSGVDYWICVQENVGSQLRVYYASGGADDNHKGEGVTYNSWDDPFISDSSSTIDMSFYATYTF